MKIFITGASGFIGGAVAATLAKAGHAVRGLIRDPSRADELRAFGIEPVLGTLDDSALLQEESPCGRCRHQRRRQRPRRRGRRHA